jgi:hypothetical protein
MENKDKDRKSSFFEKKEEKPNKEPNKQLNAPSVPMRRKNKILGDGKDWFDTHPDG